MIDNLYEYLSRSIMGAIILDADKAEEEIKEFNSGTYCRNRFDIEVPSEYTYEDRVSAMDWLSSYLYGFMADNLYFRNDTAGEVFIEPQSFRFFLIPPALNKRGHMYSLYVMRENRMFKYSEG